MKWFTPQLKISRDHVITLYNRSYMYIINDSKGLNIASKVLNKNSQNKCYTNIKAEVNSNKSPNIKLLNLITNTCTWLLRFCHTNVR